jgi:hypothetical protein
MKEGCSYHLVKVDSKEVRGVWPHGARKALKSLVENSSDQVEREGWYGSEVSHIDDWWLLASRPPAGIVVVNARIDEIKLFAH